MSANSIKTGLLAFGMSGKVFHAPLIDFHPGFEFWGVLERNTKTAAKFYPDVVSYDRLEDILNDENIELIVINSPNNLHYEHARTSLLSGKHVLVEKPVSVNLEELSELLRIAKQKNRHLFVYQNRRWDSDFQSVVQILENKVIGRLVEAHFRYDRYKTSLSTKSFKENPDYPGNGLLYDLGPHLIDQVISLFGKPISSHRVTAVQRPGSTVTDYFSFQLSFPDQLNVFVTASLLVAKPQPAFILHGTKGSYIKYRSDVQEFQLLNHIGPDDPFYGIESHEMKGRLTTMEGELGNTCDQPIEVKGNYPGIYEAIYQTIRNDIAFPVTSEQLIWQISLLEGKDL
jgi:scyllo-inositol 2-dehydrogenase (NADP+)